MITAVVLLTIQIAFLFSGLARAAETGKSDWWPTKQYSWTDVLLVLITAIYVIATAAYVVISKRQWAILKDTLEETRRTTGLTLRAYVGLEEATIESVKDGTYWAHITIKNAGLTPALTVDCLGGIDVGMFPELGSYGPPTHPGARGVLLPRCTISQNLRSKIFTPDEEAGIQANALTLIAYGEIRYVDFFGTERVTTYRVMAQPQDLRPALEKTAMLVCRDGNSMT